MFDSVHVLLTVRFYVLYNHSYDYRPNGTPLSPGTITNEMYFFVLKYCVEGPIIRRGAYKKQFTVIGKISIQCSNPYSNFILFRTNSEFD